MSEHAAKKILMEMAAGRMGDMMPTPMADEGSKKRAKMGKRMLSVLMGVRAAQKKNKKGKPIPAFEGE